MSESSISKIECLKQNPFLVTLAIIADYLGCYFRISWRKSYPERKDSQAMELLGRSAAFDVSD